MGLICTIIATVICIFSLIRHKKIYHPVVSFALLYSLIMFMSWVRAYNYYAAQDKAYFLITLGVVCFAVGSLTVEKLTIKYRKGKAPIVYQLNYKMFYIMLILCLIIIIPRFITILLFILRGNSIGDVYVILAGSAGMENEITQNGMQNLLMQFIGFPLLYIVVPTAVVIFFKTFKKKFLILSLSIAIMLVLLDSRRTYLISFFLFVFIAFIISLNEGKVNNFNIIYQLKKLKKWSLIVLIGVIFFFYFITQQRAETVANGEVSLIHTFYNYYGGTVQYFGYCLEEFNKEYTLGFTTFRGFFSPIFGIIRYLGIDSPHLYQVATDIVNGMKYIVLYVSPIDRFNSFTTCFYQFYCDGGIIGIVILSYLFGAYSQSLYKKCVETKQIRYETKYLYFYGVILMLSFTNMRTILIFIAWPLIIERILYKKSRRKSYNVCRK